MHLYISLYVHKWDMSEKVHVHGHCSMKSDIVLLILGRWHHTYGVLGGK